MSRAVGMRVEQKYANRNGVVKCCLKSWKLLACPYCWNWKWNRISNWVKNQLDFRKNHCEQPSTQRPLSAVSPGSAESVNSHHVGRRLGWEPSWMTFLSTWHISWLYSAARISWNRGRVVFQPFLITLVFGVAGKTGHEIWWHRRPACLHVGEILPSKF